jgi:putative ABC transport system ATP-binding protein
MTLLGELHRGGTTICMVTHDPRFARHAQRTLQLFDGRIVEEEGVPQQTPAAAASVEQTVEVA